MLKRLQRIVPQLLNIAGFWGHSPSWLGHEGELVDAGIPVFAKHLSEDVTHLL